MQALSDVWTLDVSGSPGRMRWERATIAGRKRRSPPGYHTANIIVQNVMIVVGGSDDHECFH